MWRGTTHRGSPRPASTFLNPNHLAAWLAAAALFAAGSMFAKERSARERSLHAVAVVLALSGVFVTGSRGALLGLLAGAAAQVGLSFRSLSARARRGMLAASAVLVLGAGAGVAVRFRSDDDPYRFHRTKIWAASFRSAVSSPFFGSGPGQFAAEAPNLNFPLENAHFDSNARSGRRTPTSCARCASSVSPPRSLFSPRQRSGWRRFFADGTS